MLGLWLVKIQGLFSRVFHGGHSALFSYVFLNGVGIVECVIMC